MNLIIGIIVGGIAGWLAGQIMGSTFSVLGNIIIGVVGGFAFYVANQLISPISLVYGMPPLLCVLLPSCIFLCCAIWVLTRR